MEIMYDGMPGVHWHKNICGKKNLRKFITRVAKGYITLLLLVIEWQIHSIPGAFKGCVLLVAAGGSGEQNLSRLAAHISSPAVFQIIWKKDWKPEAEGKLIDNIEVCWVLNTSRMQCFVAA